MASEGNKSVVKNVPLKRKSKRIVPGNNGVQRELLCTAVAQANKLGDLLDKRLAFTIDDTPSNLAVKIIDKSTGKVLRVITPGKMLRMAEQLKKLQVLNERLIGAAKSVMLELDC